jgi:TonB family protein
MLSSRLLSFGALIAALATSTAARAQTSPDSTYNLSVVEVQPRVVNVKELGERVRSEYPASLRGSGTQGEVTLRFAVDVRGRVDPNTITIVSTTHEDFNEPARRVAQRTRFRPAMIEDRPVRVIVEIPLRFRSE